MKERETTMRKIYNIFYEIYLFTDYDPHVIPTEKVIDLATSEEQAHEYCKVWNWKHKEEMPFTKCYYRERMEEIPIMKCEDAE